MVAAYNILCSSKLSRHPMQSDQELYYPLKCGKGQYKHNYTRSVPLKIMTICLELIRKCRGCIRNRIIPKNFIFRFVLNRFF